MDGISLIGLPYVELELEPEDPEELELETPGWTHVSWLVPELEEFVSQEDDEFRDEDAELMDDVVWLEGGGGARIKK